MVKREGATHAVRRLWLQAQVLKGHLSSQLCTFPFSKAKISAMNDGDYVDPDTTRLRQQSAWAVSANHASMQRWGAYNLLKVTAHGPVQTEIGGYFTTLMAISGKTPRLMEDLLGLRTGDLSGGADIYRLGQIPGLDQFEPRGYTTMVDGYRLQPGLTQDTGGYRPGQGAWQATLKRGVKVSATLIVSLAVDQPFDPGLHPNIRARYGRS